MTNPVMERITDIRHHVVQLEDAERKRRKFIDGLFELIYTELHALVEQEETRQNE